MLLYVGRQFVGDLIANSIWLLGSLAVLAILGTSALLIGKLSKMLVGREVEIDSMFYFAGAFVGMLFLPSGDRATLESQVALVFALAFGAFVGGLVGLAVEVRLSKSPPLDRDRSTTVKEPQNKATLFSRTLGRIALVVLLLAAGAIVVVSRLDGLPFLSPIVEFIRQVLKVH